MRIKKAFTAVVLSLVILVALLFVAFEPYIYNENKSITALGTGWSLQYENNYLTDVDLNKCSADDIAPKGLKHNTVLTMETCLSQANIDSMPAIMFKSKHCAYEVYLDGEKIADYAMEDYENGKYIGSIYHFVSLPSDYAGCTLTIKFYIGLDNPFATFNPLPLLGSRTALQKSLLHENMASIGIAGFLIVLGMVFVALSFLLWRSNKEFIAQVVSALFMTDSGVYILHFAGVAFLFEDSRVTTVLEFTSLYLYIPLLLLLLCCIIEPKRKRLIYAISIIISALDILLIVLHFTGVAVFNRTLNYFYMLTLVSFVMLIIYVIYHTFIRKLELVAGLQLIALFIAALFFLAQEGIYVVVRTFNLPNNIITQSILAVGALIFAMLNIATYIFYMTEAYAREAEYISLTKIAYIDGLTGLSNRLRCEKVMDEFVSRHPGEEYCIMSIDVNDLKIVNDTYGHSEGDRYLRTFAQMLKRRFAAYGECGRYGGDEFIVFFENISEQQVNALIGDLKTEIDYHNLQEKEIKFSASWGYAFASEISSGKCSEVYALADKRMYENKRSYHNSRMTMSR